MSSPQKLRGQSLDGPGIVRLPGIEEPVVQSMRAALPEFECAGLDSIAAPERGQGDLAAGKLALHLLPFHLQHLAGSNDMALRRRPGGKLAV